MDRSIPLVEDIKLYRQTLIESSGAELLQVLLILIQLLEEEKKDPLTLNSGTSLSEPNTLM